MAAIRGFSGPSVDPSSMPWPAGTVAGDLAILWDPVPSAAALSGWARISGDTWLWSRRVTASDLAGALPVSGHVSALITLSGAGGVGRVSDSEYCRIQAGCVGLWVGWKSGSSSSALASATYQLGPTVTATDDGYRHAIYGRAVTTTGYYDPGSVDDRTHMVSVEILPMAAPLAPTWVAPLSGSAVDRTQPTSVAVAHQSACGGVQDRLRVGIRPAGGTWQHVSDTGTIVATAQELAQTSGQVQIAANQLTANQAYELRAVTHDDGGWSPYGASLTVTARTPPTAVVTLTTAAGDLSPTVSAVLTPGVGVESSWEACIALAGAGPDSAPAIWTSGLQRGTDTSWQAPAWSDAVNGGSYVGWWRYSDGALRSAWTASTAQTVSWTPPAAPASCVAADGAPPTVTATGVPGTSVGLDWQWYVAPGEWVDLMSTEGPTYIRVPQAPCGVGRMYRVRSIAVVDGVRLASAWVTSSPMTSTDGGAYIVGSDGREYVPVGLCGAGVPVPIQGVSMSGGLGADYQRVDRTPVAGHTSWWEVVTETATDYDLLMGWLTSSARPRVLLRQGTERTPDGAMVDTGTVLVAVTDVAPDRVVQAAVALRSVRFGWTTQGV